MKKLLSILLALALMISLLPAALAEDIVIVEPEAEVDPVGAEAPSGQEDDIAVVDPEATAPAGETNEIIASGTCGVNLTWTLDEEGTLAISGTGKMTDFEYCRAPWYNRHRNQIKTLLIESGVTSIGKFAFYECEGLTSVTIPDSVTSIGGWAFSYCNILTSVTIPDSVTSIDRSAFAYCGGLTSITIGNSVTSIGRWAFGYCGLTSVTIPDSVTSIGDNAFTDCHSLTRFFVRSGNQVYQSIDGVVFSKDGTKLCIFPGGRIGSYSIPNSVTSIAKFAFYECEGLTSVTISDSVTSIGDDTFYNCSSLASVTIPDSVTSIGNDAFYGCSSLASVTIPDSVTSIGNDAFHGCSSLTIVMIPDSVTSIGDGAFSYCSILTSVTIPDSVTSIGDVTFYNCSSLASVTIPDSVTSIGGCAFEGCSSLTNVAIPDSVTSIGYSAFEDCSSLTSVTIGNGVTSIGGSAFWDCSVLTDVYYAGSEQDWNRIEIAVGNEWLTSAAIHYNSTGPEINDRLDRCLSRSSIDYDNELALIAAELSLATYTGEDDSDVRAYLYGLGFESANIYSNNYGGSLAFTLATKPYCGDDECNCTDVLVIVAQGSTNPYELVSDSLSWTSTGINGVQSYNIVIDFYNAICEGMDHMIAEQLFSEEKNYKVLLTGHSLGGAAVDLYGAAYTDLNGSKDVFCYTFGAINSIKSDSCMAYANIHNVYNDMDTFSPSQYGWILVNGAGRKYGKWGHLDSFSHEYRENFYHNPFLTALEEAEIEVAKHVNHDMSNYLEAVRAGRVGHSSLYDFPYTTIACPVDVDVFSGGALVGRVKDNVIDESVTTIDMAVVGEVKFIFNPDNRPLDFVITAFDDGAMTYYTQDPTGAGAAKLMYYVDLVPGKELYSEVGGEIETQDVKLYILDEEGTPVLEVKEDGTETEIAPELRLNGQSTQGVALHWSPIYGASSYLLEIRLPECVGYIEVDGTDYLYTDMLQMGENYSFRVCACMGESNTEWSESIEVFYNPFSDVSGKKTTEYVAWAYNNDIVKGTSPTTFAPDDSCTRIQFIMMLWKMNGSPIVKGENPFSDISGRKTTNAILWALDAGVINSGKTFNPNGNISRVQIVMMLWKLAGSPEVSGKNPFTDVSGSKTTKAVLWAYQNGITKGTSATTFAPDKDCTRVQLVVFLYKFNGIYHVI